MRTSVTTLCIITLAVGLATAAVGQNLLDDPGFELATGGTQTSNSAWVLEVNFPDGSDPAAQFQAEPWASNPTGTPGVGVWLRPFEGNQSPGDPPANALLRQDVAGTGGIEYAISAWYKQESFFTTKSTVLGIEFFDAGAGSLGEASMRLDNLHPGDGSWIQYGIAVIAPASTATIRAFAQMTNGIDALQNPQSAFFDDFNLMVAPPTAIGASTWAKIKSQYR